MEGEAEQALLAAGEHLGRRGRAAGARAAGQAHDAAGLLEHPQPGVVAGRDADVGRPVEAARDALGRRSGAPGPARWPGRPAQVGEPVLPPTMAATAAAPAREEGEHGEGDDRHAPHGAAS